jgi:membrane-associated phospholipid phosphatase
MSRLALAGVLFAAVGCSTAEPGTRWSRHFDGSVWSGALDTQAKPNRLIPEAVLAATIPVGYIYDRRIHEHTEDREITSKLKTPANVLQFVAPVVPIAIGVIQMAEGDDGRHLEVAVESLGLVVALQQTLAWTVRRDRPDHESRLSFPSGHTGWLFAATTLVVRNLHEPDDDAFHPLDSLFYIPACFAGWERIVRNRHWASDVAVGAFLGVFLTNLIWDAHFKTDDETRRVIHMDDAPRGTAWKPGVDMIEGRLVLSLGTDF